MENPDKQISIRPSTVEALRLLANGMTIGEAAKAIGREEPNLRATINRLRADFPGLTRLVDQIRKEGLLQKSSVQAAVKKLQEAKDQLADEGVYTGSWHYGWERMGRDPKENPIQMSKVCKIYDMLEQGKGFAEIGRDADVDLSQRFVRVIARSALFKGEFPDRRGIHRGNWKPPIDPERWDRVQRMLPPRGGSVPLFGYKWWDGKGVAKPSDKEKVDQVVALRKQGKSQNEIEKESGLPNHIVWSIFTDRRRTGKMEVDGKLVDSGYEQIIAPEDFEAVQKIRLPRGEQKKDRAKNTRRNIMKEMPAYRWELYEKLELPRSSVDSNVRRLKEDGSLRERSDGLLQRSWEPYPERKLESRLKYRAKQRLRIVEILSEKGEVTLKQLCLLMDLPYKIIRARAAELKREGFLKETRKPKKAGRLRLSEELLKIGKTDRSTSVRLC